MLHSCALPVVRVLLRSIRHLYRHCLAYESRPVRVSGYKGPWRGPFEAARLQRYYTPVAGGSLLVGALSRLCDEVRSACKSSCLSVKCVCCDCVVVILVALPMPYAAHSLPSFAVLVR